MSFSIDRKKEMEKIIEDKLKKYTSSNNTINIDLSEISIKMDVIINLLKNLNLNVYVDGEKNSEKPNKKNIIKSDMGYIPNININDNNTSKNLRVKEFESNSDLDDIAKKMKNTLG